MANLDNDASGEALAVKKSLHPEDASDWGAPAEVQSVLKDTISDQDAPVDSVIDRVKHHVQQPPEPIESDGWTYYPPETMGQGISDDDIKAPLVGKLIADGDFALLAGDEGTGKSVTAVYMARVIAGLDKYMLGNTLLRNEAGPKSVALIEDEMGKAVLEQRHGSLLRGNYLHYETTKGQKGRYAGLTIDEKRKRVFGSEHRRARMIEKLFDMVVVKGVPVAIVDNLSSMLVKMNREEIHVLVDQITEIKAAGEDSWGHRVTIIVLAHLRKQDSSWGFLKSKEVYADSLLKQKLDSLVMLGRCSDQKRFYLKATKTGRVQQGIFTGGKDGEVMVMERKAVPMGKHDEYHLEAIPGPHMESDVMERPNPTVEQRGGIESWKDVAKIADAYVRKQRESKGADFELNPSKLQYALKQAKKLEKHADISISSVDTLTKYWDDITDLMKENPGHG